MINIDWSYAPPGAEHFHNGDILYRPHWRKSGFYCDLGLEAFGWIKDTYPSPINECIERPQPKPWSGPEDGLPPVGMVCEFAGGTECPEDPFDKDLKEGMKATIIAHFKCGDFTLAAFTFDPENPDRGMVQVEQANFGCFRKIKTPEQLASEKRETAIAEMAKVLPSAKHECWTCNPDGSVKPYENTYEILGLLVDAGFKREVV